MFSCLKSRKNNKKENLQGTDLQAQLIYQKTPYGVSTAPAGYQLATIAQCQANWSACQSAVNNDGDWAVCSLADGKVSGSGYGYQIQSGSYLDLGCAICTPAPAQLVYQKNSNGYSTAPPGYQLATVAQCQANLTACKDAVNNDGTKGICSLADGRILGSGFGYEIQNGSYLNQGCAILTPAPATSSATSSCPDGLPTVASGGQCGAGKGCCPNNECCSRYGYCSVGGTYLDACGNGCNTSYSNGRCDVCKDVVVTVTTQNWGNECGWYVNGTDLSSGGFGKYGNYQTYTKSACLKPGIYTFTATDKYGDGWNGTKFSITVNGTQVVRPTTFTSGYSFSKTFTV